MVRLSSHPYGKTTLISSVDLSPCHGTRGRLSFEMRHMKLSKPATYLLNFQPLDRPPETIHCSEPCHLFAIQRLSWTVDVEKNVILNAMIGISKRSNPGWPLTESLHFALNRALLVDQYVHAPDSIMAVANQFTNFTNPLDPLFNYLHVEHQENQEWQRWREQGQDEGAVCFFPVDSDDELRFLTLAIAAEQYFPMGKDYYRFIVVRNRVCVQYCLDVCRKVGSRLLVL